MTVEELLADLRERIDRGVDELEDLATDHEGGREKVRLLGKASGLLVVRDWLRSYETPENVEEQRLYVLMPRQQGRNIEDRMRAMYATPPENVECPR